MRKKQNQRLARAERADLTAFCVSLRLERTVSSSATDARRDAPLVHVARSLHGVVLDRDDMLVLLEHKRRHLCHSVSTRSTKERQLRTSCIICAS